ncbi:MAG: sigma-54-dependent transcriptional regulator [Myxococcota bacterium]
MSKILVVDDEPRGVKLLTSRLEEAGHVLIGVGSVGEARALLDRELFDLLISDVRLPDGSGLDLLKHAKQTISRLPVIVVTAFGSIRDAITAMQHGATEYVLKPFELEAMALLVERTLEAARIRDEHSYLLHTVREGEDQVDIVGHSPQMQQVRSLIAKVAATRSNVLLLGESGTGKELVATAIHAASSRRAQPLVKVNCPGIPAQLFESELFGHMKGSFTGAYESRKGKFELAGDGNILLDEISEIPPELQAKLLRVLEERSFTRVGGSTEVKVEARVIAATNRDIRAMVHDGRFRADLYYRLNVFPIELPTLRERKQDIPSTALHLLCHVGSACGVKAQGISDQAMHALSAYDWPGNVRELRNILERALVLAGGGIIDVEHLPVELQGRQCACASSGSFHVQVETFRRNVLLTALRESSWSKKGAAKQLGLTQRAFSHYVAKYELDAEK